MKKLFYILASAIVALGAMACQNEVDESINPNTQSEGLSFTATINQDTKVAWEGLTPSWEVGDVVIIENREIVEKGFKFVYDGEKFTCTEEGVEALVGTTVFGAYGKVDSTKGLEGTRFTTQGEMKAEGTTLAFSPANALLKFKKAASNITLNYEGATTWPIVVNALTPEADGTYYVAIWAGEDQALSYSVNGTLVKSTTMTFEAGKIYNLGTLGYEFTTITTKEQLIAFAEHVNAGNSYEGKTVKLGNDIDLEGAEWTPIGNLDVIKYDNVNSTFLGTFDGQGYTISNFTIDQTGEAVGFFGAKYAGDIKDVKFDGVTVTGTHYGAVVVGWTDGAQRNADGQWNITGCEVKNSTVTLAPDTTPDNGDKAGAIVGYAYAINVTGNTVSKTTIQAYRDLGAIAGMAQENTKEATTVSGNTVGENVTVIVDNTVNYKNYTTAAQYNAGNYVGRISTNSVVENNTGEATIVLPKTAVEKLNEQIAKGESNITISESFEMTATDPRINIAEGQNVNITLAEGVVITGTFAESGSDALFNIAKGGELTIGGEGKIALTAVKGNVSNYGQYIFENCGGVLNITGGTYNVEVAGNGSATWFIPTLINNNSTSGETTTNISGGYFYSETCVNIMRQFINHKTATATFNITGGEFEGTGSKKYGIWNQNSGGSGLGYINISGEANLNNVLVENDAPKANAVVWGGTFGYEPGTAASSYNAVTIKEGYKAVENSGVWTVEEIVVAQIGATKYATLTKAIEAAQNGDTIVVLENITLGNDESSIVVPAGKTITLNLNGKTISQEKVCTASYELISNNGNLTITGEGKISFKDNSEGDPTFGWGSYTIRNNGNLTIENGTIEHIGEQAFATHMICAIFQYSGTTTINGGVISTPNYRSVRLWKGNMTINGGEFDGQLWVQAVDNTANLVITDGTFGPNGGDGSSVFVENKTHEVAVNITGGTFTTKLGASNAVKGWVKGGQFGVDPSAYVAEGYKAIENEGVWTVKTWNPVASVEGVEYEDLAEAIAKANGAVVTLLADANVATACVINANGHNLTVDNAYRAVLQSGTTYKVELKPAVIRINNMNGWGDLNITIKSGETTLANAKAMTKEGDTNVFYYELDAQHIGKEVSYYITHSWYQTSTKNVTLANSCTPIVLNTTYLQPSNGWDSDNAWFAAYFYDDTVNPKVEKWVKAVKTESSSNLYEVEIPTDVKKMIFVRMNPGSTALGWSSKWNQTENLTITHKCCCIQSNYSASDSNWY